MRHNKIYEIVLEFATSQPKGFLKPTSLLDLGCGNAELLRRVVRETAEAQGGADAFPLRRADGIDIQESLVRNSEVKEVLDGLLEIERWNPVTIRLMYGSFRELRKVDPGTWDVVVSSEVVEHLDPEPLRDLPEIVLGHLKPQLAVISTPERRFNRIFDILDEYQPPEYKPYQRYHQPEVEYELRHYDHRFEWTVDEFSSWATEHAVRHGYAVSFTGVGAFGDPIYGATVAGLDYAGVRNVFFSRLAEEGISSTPCTQIAIFTRLRAPVKTNITLPLELEPRIVYRNSRMAEPFPPRIGLLYESLEILNFWEHLEPKIAEAWYANSIPFSNTIGPRNTPTEYSINLSYPEMWEKCHPSVKHLCRESVDTFCDIMKNGMIREVGPLRDRFYEVEVKYVPMGTRLHYWFCLDDMEYGGGSWSSNGSGGESVTGQGPEWNSRNEDDLDCRFHDFGDAAEAGAWWSGDEDDRGGHVGEIEGDEG